MHSRLAGLALKSLVPYFSIITLWVISGILRYMAIEKIKVPEEDLDEMVMIYIAAAAIFFNIILAFVPHGSGLFKIIFRLFINLTCFQ